MPDAAVAGAGRVAATNGFAARGLLEWSSRASTSLPLPVSPLITALAPLPATTAARASSARIAGLTATTDLDVWVEDTPENLLRVDQALAEFRAPDAARVALREATGLDVAWMGQPPARIDLMKQVPGATFAAAWPGRVETQ